jgi:hypothetical protein
LTCHGELELFHAEIQTLGREINGFGNYKWFSGGEWLDYVLCTVCVFRKNCSEWTTGGLRAVLGGVWLRTYVYSERIVLYEQQAAYKEVHVSNFNYSDSN